MKPLYAETTAPLPSGGGSYTRKEGWDSTRTKIHVTHAGDHATIVKAIKTALPQANFTVSKRESDYFEASSCLYEMHCETAAIKRDIERELLSLLSEPQLAIKSIAIDWIICNTLAMTL
jgi:hypothetical protein